MEEVKDIGLDSLVIPEMNRKNGRYKEKSLAELAESIKSTGVQQPIIVRDIGDSQDVRLEVVAGARRVMAARIAGMEFIPCIIRNMSAEEAVTVRLVENLQREDLHPMDEADLLMAMLSIDGFDRKGLSREIGKSEAFISRRLSLLRLVEKAQKLFLKGELSAGVAFELSVIGPKEQMEILEAAEIRRKIKQEYCQDLRKVAFSPTDPELCPQAGACVDCPKRTGYEPALFPDLGVKEDNCLDLECLAVKKALIFEINKKKLDEAGIKYLLVCTDYQADLPKNMLNQYDWKELRKKDEGAVRVLIASGNDKGRISWGQKRENYGGYQKSEEDKKRERKDKAQTESKKRQARAVMDVFKSKLEQEVADGGLPEPLIREIARVIWRRISHDAVNKFGDLYGWEKPPVDKKKGYAPKFDESVDEYINKFELDDLLVGLATGACADDLYYFYGGYGGDHTSTLEKFAEILSVDVKDIKHRIETEDKLAFDGKEKARADREKKKAGKKEGEVNA